METQATPGWTIHHPTPVNVVDPEPAASKVKAITTLHVQQSGMSVSFVLTTQDQTDIPVPPTVNTIVPPVTTTRVPIQKT